MTKDQTIWREDAQLVTACTAPALKNLQVDMPAEKLIENCLSLYSVDMRANVEAGAGGYTRNVSVHA